jgi:predicted metal-dependent HD superfamily phosphohydrolase
VKLAIYFIDWIYDLQGKGNGLKSIECFKAWAKESDLPMALISLASGYIERAITRTLRSNNLRLFLNFDFELLSQGGADHELM